MTVNDLEAHAKGKKHQTALLRTFGMMGSAEFLPKVLPVPPRVDASVWAGLPHDLQSAVWALRNRHHEGEELSAPDTVLVRGQEVVHVQRDGTRRGATIAAVHRDDTMPYYTVRLEDGTEKQTVRDRLEIPVCMHASINVRRYPRVRVHTCALMYEAKSTGSPIVTVAI